MTRPKKPDPVHIGMNGVRIYPPHHTNSGHGNTMHRIVWTRPNGTRKNLWRTSREEATAVAIEVDRQLDVLAAGGTDDEAREAAGRRTVGDLADLWLLPSSHEPWSAHHQRNCNSIASKWIRPHLGHLAVVDVDDTILRDFLYQTVRSRYPKSVQRIGVACAAMFGTAIEAGWLDRNPMTGISYSTAGRTRRQGATSVYVPLDRRPDTDAVHALADTLDDMWPGRHLGDLALLAAYSGIRKSELFALTDRDLEFMDGGVRIDIVRQVFTISGDGRHCHLPKYAKIRETFAPDHVADRLARRINGHLPGAPRQGCTDRRCPDIVDTGARLLFPTLRALTWWESSNWDYKRFTPARQTADWPLAPDGSWQWTWHDLRHHAATWMLAPSHAGGRGLEVADVSYFLGHATPDFTWKAYISPRQGAVGRALGS